MAEPFTTKIMERDWTISSGIPRPTFTWTPTDAHRAQAIRNHSQTLERLNERGGLAWQELRWILKGLGWRGDEATEEQAEKYCKNYLAAIGGSAL